MFLWKISVIQLAFAVVLCTRTSRFLCDQSQRMIVFQYTWDAANTRHFGYQGDDNSEQMNRTDVYDIYVVGKRTICSKQAGMARGSGSKHDPYTLLIYVGKNKNVTDKQNCYIEPSASGMYSIQVSVQKLPYLLTAEDRVFSLFCDFRHLSKQSTIGLDTVHIMGKPPTDNPKMETSQGRLFIPGLYSSDTPKNLPLGKNIRLQAEVTDSGAKGIHVTNCKVSPEPNKQPLLTLLDGNGCSTDLNLLSPFHGIDEDGSVAQSGLFQIFKFTTSNTLYFTCQLDFCYTHADPFCAQSHCLRESSHQRVRRAEPKTPNQTDDIQVASLFLVVTAMPTSSSLSESTEMESVCIQPLTFTVTLSVLGVLLLICIISTLSQCARLCKNKKKGHHSNGSRNAHPDTGFLRRA